MTELAVLDFETTGLVPGQDEVLQVAVVDETGAVLMNEYCRPQRHTAWADAQKVNGIAPQDVCGKPPFEALVPRLQEILSGARRVVAYNDGFEKAFLDAYGIPSRGLRWGEDPMAAFAQQMGGLVERGDVFVLVHHAQRWAFFIGKGPGRGRRCGKKFIVDVKLHQVARAKARVRRAFFAVDLDAFVAERFVEQRFRHAGGDVFDKPREPCSVLVFSGCETFHAPFPPVLSKFVLLVYNNLNRS